MRLNVSDSPLCGLIQRKKRVDPELLLRQLQEALDEGLMLQLYRLASVDPDEVLSAHRSHGVEVYALGELWRVPTPMLDPGAEKLLRNTHWRAVAGSTGFALGGLLTVLPELLWYTVVLLRLGQRVALAYGYDVHTTPGRLELWQTLATSLKIPVELEGVESWRAVVLPVPQLEPGMRDAVVERLVQRVMTALALRMVKRVTRLVPVLNAGMGGVASHRQLRQLGQHFLSSYRSRHQLRLLNLISFDLSQDVPFTLEKPRR